MIPEMMTAMVFEDINVIRARQVPVPKPKRGEALVKIMASGLCITDVHVLQGLFAHSKPPCVMGHEVTGEIVEFGEEQPFPHRLKLHQRVVVETMLACGQCPQCLSGNKNLCEHGGDIGEPPFQGGYSEYITMPVGNLYPIPDNMSYEEAAIFESFVCPVGGLMRIGITPGDTVLVQGLGPAGLAFIQGAKAMGAGRILVSDMNEQRLALGKKYGAHVCINLKEQDLYKIVEQETGGRGVDICCEASGASMAYQACFDLARKNGKLIFYGIPKDTHQTRFDVTQVITKQLNLYGTSGVPCAWEPVLNLYGQGKYNIKDMVTHTFELEQMEKAVKTLSDPEKGAIKIVLYSPNNRKQDNKDGF